MTVNILQKKHGIDNLFSKVLVNYVLLKLIRGQKTIKRTSNELYLFLMLAKTKLVLLYNLFLEWCIVCREVKDKQWNRQKHHAIIIVVNYFVIVYVTHHIIENMGWLKIKRQKSQTIKPSPSQIYTNIRSIIQGRVSTPWYSVTGGKFTRSLSLEEQDRQF